MKKNKKNSELNKLSLFTACGALMLNLTSVAAKADTLAVESSTFQTLKRDTRKQKGNVTTVRRGLNTVGAVAVGLAELPLPLTVLWGIKTLSSASTDEFVHVDPIGSNSRIVGLKHEADAQSCFKQGEELANGFARMQATQAGSNKVKKVKILNVFVDGNDFRKYDAKKSEFELYRPGYNVLGLNFGSLIEEVSSGRPKHYQNLKQVQPFVYEESLVVPVYFHDIKNKSFPKGHCAVPSLQAIQDGSKKPVPAGGVFALGREDWVPFMDRKQFDSSGTSKPTIISENSSDTGEGKHENKHGGKHSSRSPAIVKELQ